MALLQALYVHVANSDPDWQLRTARGQVLPQAASPANPFPSQTVCSLQCSLPCSCCGFKDSNSYFTSLKISFLFLKTKV